MPGTTNIPNRITSSTIKMSSRLRPELRPILKAIDPVLTGFSLRLLSLAIFVSYHVAYTADRLDEAYPEDLMQAGIGDQSVDAVYINNVMTLVYDQAAALAEFARVLKPGGLLICETIFSSAERDLEVVRQARAIGNSVQAGRTKEEFFALLAAAGFGEPEIVDEYEVAADQGFKANRTVPVVESDEDVTFSAVAINVRKA